MIRENVFCGQYVCVYYTIPDSSTFEQLNEKS